MLGVHELGVIPALTELAVSWGNNIKQDDSGASLRVWVGTGVQGMFCQEKKEKRGEILSFPNAGRGQSNSPVWVPMTLEVAKGGKILGLRVKASKAKAEAKRVALLRSH